MRVTEPRAEPGFLPTTAYAVLGLLSFGRDLSGYEIRQWALGSQRYFFWSPAQSQIYRELRRLEQLGFVTATKVTQHDRPDKVVYHLTDRGMAELTRWIESSPVEPPVVKHSAALKLFFGGVADDERMADILREHAAHVGEIAETLRGLVAEIDDEPRSRFAKLAARWSLELYQGDLAGTDAVLHRITAPTGSPSVDPAEVAARFAEIEERFVEWASGRRDIRAALVVGSRAREVYPADEWSDLDIVVFADDPDRYLDDAAWPAELAPVILTFTEPTGDGSARERRVLFNGGRDVDFAFFPLTAIDRIDPDEPPASVTQSLGRGYRVLVDRIGLSDRLDSLSLEPRPPASPTGAQFDEVVSDYLYHLLWVAKHLRRGELWWAKGGMERLDGLLERMITWHAREVSGRSDTWFRGRFLETWADPAVVAELALTGSRRDPNGMARALLHHHALFRTVAVDVATSLSLAYPEDADRDVEDLTRRVLP